MRNGLVPIPIGVTGFAARKIWEVVSAEPTRYYGGIEWITPLIAELADPNVVRIDLVEKLIQILQRLSK